MKAVNLSYRKLLPILVSGMIFSSQPWAQEANSLTHDVDGKPLTIYPTFIFNEKTNTFSTIKFSADENGGALYYLGDSDGVTLSANEDGKLTLATKAGPPMSPSPYPSKAGWYQSEHSSSQLTFFYFNGTRYPSNDMSNPCLKNTSPYRIKVVNEGIDVNYDVTMAHGQMHGLRRYPASQGITLSAGPLVSVSAAGVVCHQDNTTFPLPKMALPAQYQLL